MFKVVSAPNETILRGLRAIVPDDAPDAGGKGDTSNTGEGASSSYFVPIERPDLGSVLRESADSGRLPESVRSSTLAALPSNRSDLAAVDEFLQTCAAGTKPGQTVYSGGATTTPTTTLDNAASARTTDRSSFCAGGATSSSGAGGTAGGSARSGVSGSRPLSAQKNNGRQQAASASASLGTTCGGGGGPVKCFNVTRDFKSVEHMKKQADDLRRLAQEAVERAQGLEGRPPADEQLRMKRLNNIYGRRQTRSRPSTPVGNGRSSVPNFHTTATTGAGDGDRMDVCGSASSGSPVLSQADQQHGCSPDVQASASKASSAQQCFAASRPAASLAGPSRPTSSNVVGYAAPCGRHSFPPRSHQPGSHTRQTTTRSASGARGEPPPGPASGSSPGVDDGEHMAHFFSTMQKDLEKKIADLESENRKLKSRVGAMQSERVALQASAQSGARTLQLLQERLQEAERKVGAERKKNEGYERKVRLLENRESGLLSELQKTACEKIDLAELSVAEEARDGAIAERDKLQRVVGVLRQELAAKDERIRKMNMDMGMGMALGVGT